MILPYSGARWQKGYGLGSIFRTLLRGISPLIKTISPALKKVGKRALRAGARTGVALATDALAGRDMKQAARQRFAGALNDVVGSSPPGVPARAGRKRTIKAGNGSGKRPRKRTPLRGNRHGVEQRRDIFT